MGRTYKTSKGTELPITMLPSKNGPKEYLEVKYRLVWFREDHPDWSIQTEVIFTDKDRSVVKAQIVTDTGRIIASAHQDETVQGFADHLSKAETAAIGRSLALIGYGTQFTQEFNENPNRPADSPVQPKNEVKNYAPKPQTGPPGPKAFGSGSPQSVQESTSLGDYVVPIGKKFKGKKLKDISIGELDGYIEWLTKGGTPQGDSSEEFVSKARAYMDSFKKHPVPGPV